MGFLNLKNIFYEFIGYSIHFVIFFVVVIIPFCYWDIRAGVDAGLSDEMIRYIDQALELLEQIIRQQSTEERPVTQLDLIFDMNNLSFWQLASRKSKLMYKIEVKSRT